MQVGRILAVAGGIFLALGLGLTPLAQAHEADLNDRVTFFVFRVQQSEVQGEPALVLQAVLDNGTRNRITLRGLSSDAGDSVVVYAIKDVYGLQTLLPRRTLALRSGQGVEIAPPEYTLVISELNEGTLEQDGFTLNLLFNRAIGEMNIPISFRLNNDYEHGRGVIDIGPPAALASEKPEVEWLTTDDLVDQNSN